MKTRREFFKVFAGSCAVLAACVVAPKSLMAKEPENPFNLENVKKGLEKMDYGSSTGSFSELLDPNANRINSGYAQLVDEQENIVATWTATADYYNGDKYPWKYPDSNGKWVKS